MPEHISIHALRKESDLQTAITGLPIVISIHALRKESDFAAFRQDPAARHFNPRSP